ncbi:aminotransferase class IV [Riemerella anatipestifer]|nr:aminotransferase class IV [Riemerella anatipestifer]MDY3325386.1 aminotransferase class IV [Riemerella anatipestifer]MDY3352624.1 aminotransferase class IV [Riemerella anatipestifer]
MYLDGNLLSQEQSLAYANRAFMNGDAVKVHFFFKNKKMILAEDVYFFLMSSMRKMRMNIPLSFTLEFFTDIFSQTIQDLSFDRGCIKVLVFRKNETFFSAKTPVYFVYEVVREDDLFQVKKGIELDIIKEISVNTHILSNIHTHCPENIYAEIYAQENDLDDVILLNPNKRIARSIYGNLLFLEGNTIKIPKQTEGAYISPLMESFITYIHKNRLAEIEQVEMIAFESQKANEILMISDEKGIFSVSKIRNKAFPNSRFSEMIEKWNLTLV